MHTSSHMKKKSCINVATVFWSARRAKNSAHKGDYDNKKNPYVDESDACNKP